MLIILTVGFFISPLFHTVTEEGVKNKIIALQNSSFEIKANNFLAQVPLNLWVSPCQSWLNEIQDNIDWTIDYYYEMSDNPARAKLADEWLERQVENLRYELEDYQSVCASGTNKSA